MISKLNLTDTEQLLNLFRSRDTNRKTILGYFEELYKGTEYYCATDAHAFIMIPKNSKNVISKLIPNPPQLYTIIPEFDKEINVPASQFKFKYDAIEEEEMDVWEECEACDGEGNFQHYGEGYECKSCKEKGSIKSGVKEWVKNPLNLLTIKDKPIAIKYIGHLCTCIDIIKPDVVKIEYLDIPNRVLVFHLKDVLVGIMPVLSDNGELSSEFKINKIV